MDLGELSTAVVPYATAAAAAYGGAVVERVRDAAAESSADAAVGWGRKLLTRLFASRRGDQVTSAVVELAEDPSDEASRELVRVQVLKALQADPGLAAEVEALLGEAAPPGDTYTVKVTKRQGFQIGAHN